MRKPVLAVLCLLAWILPSTPAVADGGATAAAKRVAEGRQRVHDGFHACTAILRANGLDARFLQSIWDAERYDVFEGLRLTLGKRSDIRHLHSMVSGPKISRKACNQLVETDVREQPGITGIADTDVQAMRDVFVASHPDPRSIRDHSLHMDCMKVNFNTHDVDYSESVRLCNCTVEAMHAVPEDELDSWLELAHAGVDVPMAEQAWYGIFVDRLWACSRSL